MRELLHGANNRRHSPKAINGALERLGHVFDEIREIGCLGRRLGIGGGFACGFAIEDGLLHHLQLVEHSHEVACCLAQEMHAVAHELDGRIDLMRHT